MEDGSPTSADQLPKNYKELYAFKYADTSFNAYHTWIEYINRLLGALLGLLLVVQFFWSFIYRRSDPKIIWLSFALMLLTGFQGWLGSKVVETNLEVAKVTTHMLVALVIAALSITIIHFCTSNNRSIAHNKKLNRVGLLTLALLIMQVILGTNVREQIDHISEALQFSKREIWISKLNYIFYVHRTFSLLLAGVCFYFFLICKKYYGLEKSSWLILTCVLTNIVIGVGMAYLDVPAILQPLHLVLSSILITAVYYNYLKTV